MSNTRRTGHTHRHAPSATAVVFTCGPCWDEFFPGRDPGSLHNGARTAIVGAGCEAEFVAHGFEVVAGIVQGTGIPGLFCPHLD